MRQSIIFIILALFAVSAYAADKPKYKPLNNSFKNSVIAGNSVDVDFYIQKMKPETRTAEINAAINVKSVKMGGTMSVTPLMYAVREKDLPTVKILAQNGADINLKSGGRSPLAVAVRIGANEIVQYFESLAILNSESYNSALLEAAGDFIAIPDSKLPQRESSEPINPGNAEMFKHLAGNGADIKKDEANLFIRAIDNNNVEILKYMISKGADVNTKTSFGRPTPLFNAVLRNNEEAVKLLLENGADINAKNDAGVSPVFVAVSNEKSEEMKAKRFKMLQYLVNAGADINSVDNYGSTPLSRACDIQNFEMIKYLAEHGADVNMEEILPFSVQKKGIEILSYLIERGADVKTKSGALAMLTAANAGNNEAIQFLKDKGADSSLVKGALPQKYQRFKEEFTTASY